MRKNFGPQCLIYPEPVLMIGSYNENGSMNVMTAAWGGLSDTNEVCICLSEDHKTTKNILKNKAFTVSFATKEYTAECDYLGIVSANNDKNKVKKAKFHALKSKFVNAPIIKELDLALECKLISYDKKTGHMFGSVINVSADSKILTDGKIDLKKYHPIIFDGFNHDYRVIGSKVAKAFSVGKKIK